MKNKEQKTQISLPPITTLSDLRTLIEKPLTCAFKIDGHPVRLTVKRINTQVDELRRAVVRAVVPPYVEARKDYDVLNPKYRGDRENAEDIARSLTVYHCCPEVSEGNKGLNDPNAIHAYVKNLLPPTILELIALTALAGGLSEEVNARANFT